MKPFCIAAPAIISKFFVFLPKNTKSVKVAEQRTSAFYGVVHITIKWLNIVSLRTSEDKVTK